MILNERGKILAAVLIMGAAVLFFLLAGCVKPIPRSIPPGLKIWAAQKAERLAVCYSQGARGRDLIGCLGEYGVDRGTYACERAATLAGEQRSEP